MKSMSFTVFSYNATVLLIQLNSTQPNPSHVLENATQPNSTHGWTQPMSISDTASYCRRFCGHAKLREQINE